MRLIAIKNHNYPSSTQIRAGQEYEATAGDAIVLVGARLARHAASTAEQRPAGYQTKELNAETPGEKPKRKKRQYRRKDMSPATA